MVVLWAMEAKMNPLHQEVRSQNQVSISVLYIFTRPMCKFFIYIFTGYNPLMGDSSRRYRPPKRSCCGKGGCG